ncbi:MAG: helix-turn-helix domain-containing protein [Rhodobacteraceae bacterium]|nr:helix-turn-helix domain-containing protein [Paracoccaceae bacterium]
MALHEKFERPRSHQKALDDLIGKAYADSRLTAQQKAVLICLAWHAKNRAGESYPSQATIAGLTGVCVSLVGRAIKVLCQLGYIEKRDRRRKDGGKTTCLIIIHGMQYFPEDYQNPSKTTAGPAATDSEPNVRYAQDTTGIGMGYGTKKEENLKKDSLMGAKTVEEEGKEKIQFSEMQGDRPDVIIAALKPTSQVLLKFISYLSANRQSLHQEDYDAINRFQIRPEFCSAVAAAKDRMSEPELRRQLSLFFTKRPQMQRPAASQIDAIVRDLREMPAFVARLALVRIDEIYKPGWRIPPTVGNIRNAVADEIRLMTVFTNAEVCFEMSRTSFDERQRGRKLATTASYVGC